MNHNTACGAKHKQRGSSAWQKLPILMTAALLALACQTAPPPRLVSDANASGNKLWRERTDRSIQMIKDWAITKVNGGALKIADLRGKVVVVDVWATWCGPCRKQAPQLAALNARYRERGLEIVGLSLNDPKEHQAEVEQFVKAAGINYTVAYADRRISEAFLRGTEDETGQAPIPQLFVLSRDGHLIEHFVGEDPTRGLTLLEKVVNQQLSGTESSR